MIEKIERVGAAHVASFRAAVAAGVRVACGTDAGTPLNLHGDLVTEILSVREAGLGPMDAIRAATSWAAEAIGRSDVGVLESGRYADFVVVPGDPLEVLAALGAPSEVWRGGERVVLSES
jgi:imidazolonepropionase-like amidohydrolase